MNAAQLQIIKQCQRSVSWFLSTFGRVKHPTAGILPFSPFSYQRHALKAFKDHRFVIFKKTRQCGISKISGAYALWYGMFHSNKTILIVSRTDDDAMAFLAENIRFLFDNLPEWMREIWRPASMKAQLKWNEHHIQLANGTKIRSLTSHPDVLRSNASSLNIIDEAAFIQGMDIMWAAGYPTLSHGGSCLVVSTTSGIGNWYWSTWVDAEAGTNNFHPIVINWWDMDWAIEFNDPVTGKPTRIAPRDGLKQLQSPADIDKYGPYWSPWLENQWRGLQEQGETWKFKQEVLASFIGSGNTVIDENAILRVQNTVTDPKRVTATQVYVHPTTNEQMDLEFEFQDESSGLWIWCPPERGKPMRRQGDKVIDPGETAHRYVMGVDTATGKGRDYHAIEILDIDTMEQAAEFMCRCLPRQLLYYMDFLGRQYNNAMMVIERNNGGDILIDEMRHQFMYTQRLWRRKQINDKPRPQRSTGGDSSRAMQVKPYGFATTAATKPWLNRLLVDNIRADDTGYQVYSRRLLKQISIYVRKKDRQGRDTMRTEAEEGPGNYDDLVMAFGLALMAAVDHHSISAVNMAPVYSSHDFKSNAGPIIPTAEAMIMDQKEILAKGGPYLLLPLGVAPEELPELGAQRQLDAFTIQLGAIPTTARGPVITPPKYFHTRKRAKS